MRGFGGCKLGTTKTKRGEGELVKARWGNLAQKVVLWMMRMPIRVHEQVRHRNRDRPRT